MRKLANTAPIRRVLGIRIWPPYSTSVKLGFAHRNDQPPCDYCLCTKTKWFVYSRASRSLRRADFKSCVTWLFVQRLSWLDFVEIPNN